MAGSDNGNSVVIVALPAENDLVRKVSSEKEPHLTLLYLGDADFGPDGLTHVTDYVKYASSMLAKFSLDVVTRGTLGDKDADVLFFNKKWSENIARFRDMLLQDPRINAAYNATEQYEGWTPHLTLGYPETPAKNFEEGLGEFYSVRFDRVAIWVGDSIGPTFDLLPYDHDYPAVAMSQMTDSGRTAVDDFLKHLDEAPSDDFNLDDEYGGFLDLLETYIPEETDPSVEHYGVKGMHWGVRKDDSSKSRPQLKSLGPDSVSRKTKSGETITLQKVKPNVLVKSLGRVSKKFREGYSKRASLNILDGSGKKVGEAYVQKKNDEELYLNWLGIDKSARGKGYATAVMKAGRDFGKQQGFKKMTLEVPGHSPDARHIYEKLGFKVTGEDKGPGTEMWGGLTNMEYNFDAKHSGFEEVNDFLQHYGIKGMKWGVRKDKGHEGESARTSKIARLDKKFEKRSGSLKTVIAIHNRAAELTNKNDVDRINNKPQYKNADFSKDTPLRRKYYEEHQKAFLNNLEKAASEAGTNASGTRKYTILEGRDGDWDVVTKEIVHADDEASFTVNVKYDDSGRIVGIEMPSLTHYGIKGMKWGVRRADNASDSSSSTPASSDAKLASETQTKINTGGVKTVSNQELQHLVNRLNLEKQYSQLQTTNKSDIQRGHKVVKDILQAGKTIEDVRKFMNSPTGKLLKSTLKGTFAAGKVAAAAYTGGAGAAARVGAEVAVRRAANHYTNVGR